MVPADTRPAALKTAFITPSYRGDYDRCRLLCESTDRFLPQGFEHVLIVDRRDLGLFRPLETARIRVVEAESLLPWWIFRVPGINRFRISLRSPPIRNWIYQQLLKFSAASATDADILQFVDSDVVLTRPFDPAYLFRDGKVRLQHTGDVNPEHRHWLETAARILKTDRAAIGGNYVGNFITWRADNVRALYTHLEEQHAASWIEVLARTVTFSEYMIYGAFVDHVLGTRAAGHFADDRPNLFLSWGYDVSTRKGLEAFLADAPDESFGLMIHSKLGISATDYEEMVRAKWRRWG